MFAGCAPSPSQRAAAEALDYLERTGDELGLDVVVATQIYADQRDDARAAEVAALRRAGLRPDDVARWGALLEIDKPALAPSTLDGVPASEAPPNPDDELADDRVVECTDEALSCAIGPECLDYLALEGRGGYMLTHQAAFLLIAGWRGCEADLDEDARRHALAERLAREMAADPAPSDLAFERLAMLAHLGFASEIEPAWIEDLLASQDPSGCFEVQPGSGCHPHPTGVALWTLAHVD